MERRRAVAFPGEPAGSATRACSSQSPSGWGVAHGRQGGRSTGLSLKVRSYLYNLVQAGEVDKMSEQGITFQTMNVSDARKQWSELLNKVARKETRVLVEKSGAPVAAIVSADDLRRLQEMDARRWRDGTVLEEIGRAFVDVPEEELEREIARALAEVRLERQGSKAQRAGTS
jgi:prevent-host-death family protein